MAARIAGVNLPDNKKIPVALSYIKGIGRTKSLSILSQAKVDIDKRVKELSEEEVNIIRTIIDKSDFLVEGELDRQIHANIKRLKEIGAYRGSRHSRHLPARGQRTKTNSRTVRGNVRKTTTSGKKPAAQKT